MKLKKKTLSKIFKFHLLKVNFKEALKSKLIKKFVFVPHFIFKKCAFIYKRVNLEKFYKNSCSQIF